MAFDITKDVPDSDVPCGRCDGKINIWDEAGGSRFCWNCKVEMEKERDALYYPSQE